MRCAENGETGVKQACTTDKTSCCIFPLSSKNFFLLTLSAGSLPIVIDLVLSPKKWRKRNMPLLCTDFRKGLDLVHVSISKL